MVLSFDFGDPENAATYAGLLIAAFSLAESLTGVFWGGLSDKFGRKPVLLLGCIGTMVSLLIVGMAKSFWVALLGRVLGGLLNGNAGVIQTMVGEIVTNPAHEPKAYSVMPFVWSIGAIAGPALGGCFAEPAKTFPNLFSTSGVFGRFPYLLPNVICAAILLFAVVLGFLLLNETHPDMLMHGTEISYSRGRQSFEHADRRQSTAATEHASSDMFQDYGTFNGVTVPDQDYWDINPNGKESPRARQVFTSRIKMLIAALGIFTYLSMTYDHLLPIYLQYPRGGGSATTPVVSQAFAGGLGLSTQKVGVIMSVNGVIAMAIQGIVFPIVVSSLGVWRSFILVTIGHPLAYWVVPYLSVMPTSSVEVGIYACLTLRNIFSILAYPLLLILIKESCPHACHLGKINGLAASVAAGCRCVAPPLAGYLFSVGSKIDFVPLAWWSSAAVGMLAIAQALLVRRPRETAVVRSLAHHMSRESLREQAKHVIRVRVHDTIEEGSDEDADETHPLL